MPASEVMSLYRQHKLHSGPGGPVVKKKKQAVAIQISMARKEGHHIPEVKGSFQQGGLVPETGNYKVHEGEQLAFSKRVVPPGYGGSQDVEDRRQPWNASRVGAIEGREQAQRSAQEKDIAARTNQAQHDEWNRAMRQKLNYGGPMEHGRPSEALGTPPLPRDVPPAGNDPHYAIEGLKGNVAARMREQGERAAGIRGSFQQGGTVQQTGDYQVHQGEELMPPPERVSAPGPTTSIEKPGRKPVSGSGGNPQLEQMQSAVAAPLHRVEGFKRGGTIPRTGIYRLHQGEQVIPKSLAGRYRQMKERHG